MEERFSLTGKLVWGTRFANERTFS